MFINDILHRTENKLSCLRKSVFKIISNWHFELSGQKEELELTKDNLIFWLPFALKIFSKKNFQKFDSENNRIIYLDKIYMMNRKLKLDHYYSYQIKFKGRKISPNAELQRELFIFDTEEKKYKSKRVETIINTNNRRDFVDGFKNTGDLFRKYIKFNINKSFIQ